MSDSAHLYRPPSCTVRDGRIDAPHKCEVHGTTLIAPSPPTARQLRPLKSQDLETWPHGGRISKVDKRSHLAVVDRIW